MGQSYEYFARVFAQEIISAANDASVTGDHQLFYKKMREVFRRMDSLNHGDSTVRITESHQEVLMEMVDANLNVPEGTLVHIREGSVQKALDYERRVGQLLTRILES